MDEVQQPMPSPPPDAPPPEPMPDAPDAEAVPAVVGGAVAVRQKAGKRQPGALVGPRVAADAYVSIHGGGLSFYSKRRRFEAVCGDRFHHIGNSRCVMTRHLPAIGTASGAASGSRDPMPQPTPRAVLGQLVACMAWADMASDKQEHWEAEHTNIDKEERALRRQELLLTPGGASLAARDGFADVALVEEPDRA